MPRSIGAARAASSAAPPPSRTRFVGQRALGRAARLDGVAGRAGAVAGDRRGAQVVDDRVGDAVLDERHRPASARPRRRRSAASVRGKRRRVAEVDRGRGDLLARGARSSAPRRSACARPLNASQPRELEQDGDGVGREHDGVLARLDRDAVLARRVLDGALRERGRVELGHRARGGGRVAAAAVRVAADDLHERVGHVVGRADPRARRDRRAHGARGPQPERLQPGVGRAARTPLAARPRPVPGSRSAVSASQPATGAASTAVGQPGVVAVSRARSGARDGVAPCAPRRAARPRRGGSWSPTRCARRAGRGSRRSCRRRRSPASAPTGRSATTASARAPR